MIISSTFSKSYMQYCIVQSLSVTCLRSFRPSKNPKGGTLIFSYIRRLGSFFGVLNFEFQYFLGFSEK